MADAARRERPGGPPASGLACPPARACGARGRARSGFLWSYWRCRRACGKTSVWCCARSSGWRPPVAPHPAVELFEGRRPVGVEGEDVQELVLNGGELTGSESFDALIETPWETFEE